MSKEMYWNIFISIVRHSFPEYEPTEKARNFSDYGYEIQAPVEHRAAGWISRIRILKSRADLI